MFTVSFSSSSRKTTSGSHPPRGAAPGGCPPTPPGSATRVSPGTGLQVAWTSWRDGQPEIFTADPEGAGQARLTYWGDNRTRVTGWTQAGEVLAVSAAGQPENQYSWAYAVPLHGAPPRRLPFGPVSDLALESAGTALLTSRENSEPAFWKRYRGGTAGKLWIATGDDPLFTQILADLNTQLGSPMLIGGRLFFLSDHEGTGNIYSCALDGTDLARHTDHDGKYARNPSTDGHRIVYHVAGDIWMLDGPEAAGPHPVQITLGSPSAARAPRLVTARDHLGSLDCDQTGQASVVEVRGTVHWLTHQDGPARALHVDPDARARLPRVLGETGKVVWVTDAAGSQTPDALEVGSVTGEPRSVRLTEGLGGTVTSLSRFPGRGYGRGRPSRRPTLAGRYLKPSGHRAARVRQRARRGTVLLARLGLAGLVPSRALAAAPPVHGQSGRPRDRRGDRRPVLRYRSGIHRRRPVPGFFVAAQLRPGLRRAVLRPVVSVRQPPLPGHPRRADPLAVRAPAWWPSGEPGSLGRGQIGFFRTDRGISRPGRPAQPRGGRARARGPVLGPAGGLRRPGLAARAGHRRARRERPEPGRRRAAPVPGALRPAQA